MSGQLHLWETPRRGLPMIAGWDQWADAGDVSSGLPAYLIEKTGAARIGRIDPGGYYLFQVPGTHHLLRPVVRLAEGCSAEMRGQKNEFYVASDGSSEFLIFVGTEPQRNETEYANVFFSAIERLGVPIVASVAGVHGPMPHWRERRVSCVYSDARTKAELDRLDVRFSNYHGGATIGMYMAARAASWDVRFARLCAYVPSYSFTAGSVVVHRMAMDEDYCAWHSLTRRLNRLLGLDIELSDLASECDGLIGAWTDQVEELASTLPHLGVNDYLEEIEQQFDDAESSEGDDPWGTALQDILDDAE